MWFPTNHANRSSPQAIFSFPFDMAQCLPRVALREASARSANRGAAWIRNNALPPLPEARVTLEELRDSALDPDVCDIATRS